MFKITFKNRAEGRRFLRLSKKHPLFKMYFVGWEDRVITFQFKGKRQAEVIPNIIKAVLAEMNIEYSIVE